MFWLRHDHKICPEGAAQSTPGGQIASTSGQRKKGVIEEGSILDRRIYRQFKGLQVTDFSTMSDPSWLVKNGDLTELKNLVEKVSTV